MKKIVLFSVCFLLSIFAFSQKKQMSKNRMVEFENGKKYEIETENDKVTLFKIDGETVDKNNYKKHQAVIDRLQKGTQNMNLDAADDMSTESSEQTISTVKEGENTAIMISGSETEDPIKLIVTKEGKIIFNGENLKDGSVLKLKTNKNISKIASKSETSQQSNEAPSQKKTAQTTKKRVVLESEDNVQKVAQEDDEWLVDELYKDKIIKERGTVDFEITDRQLSVNGALQSENMWKKYKSLYESHGVKFDKNTKINITRSTN